MDLLAGLLSLRDLLDKEKLRQFAETLPTPQQNIDTLRQGATSAMNKLVGGFNRMADQATQQGASVRDQLLQKYNDTMNPPQVLGPMDPTALARFEQLQRDQLMQAAQQMKSAQPETPTLLGVLPDGSRVSKEAERAYWDEQQKAFSKKLLGEKPAPTRAAMRAKLAAQEAPAASEPSLLYAPLDVQPDVPVPNTYKVDEGALLGTAREKHPWMTSGMDDAALREAILSRLPEYGVSYSGGVARVDPANEQFQSFQADMPLSLYAKPMTRLGGATTNWGGKPTGPALPPRAAVPPQGFADQFPIMDERQVMIEELKRALGLI